MNNKTKSELVKDFAIEHNISYLDVKLTLVECEDFMTPIQIEENITWIAELKKSSASDNIK